MLAPRSGREHARRQLTGGTARSCSGSRGPSRACDPADDVWTALEAITHEGPAAAQARGRTGGRKPKLTGKQVTHARTLYAGGEYKVADIAKPLGA